MIIIFRRQNVSAPLYVLRANIPPCSSDSSLVYWSRREAGLTGRRGVLLRSMCPLVRVLSSRLLRVRRQTEYLGLPTGSVLSITGLESGLRRREAPRNYRTKNMQGVDVYF